MKDNYPLLEKINLPEDLRKLEPELLERLCSELRNFIIDKVSRFGGHFSANLGTVELTTALHYVFNTPHDKLIWDVGHQAYGHKILTGRRESFETNRLKGGLSGFPKMAESAYDAFGTGHSSTSVSAAFGMAVAASLRGETGRQHIAVIGDGALTAGMAFEALNHAGSMDANLLVVLNDNSMSIDPNVGALKNYLDDLTHKEKKDSFREDIVGLLKEAASIGLNSELLQKLESSANNLLGKNINFFESLNFRYFGPIDGHDIGDLVTMLEKMKQVKGPKLLHVITLKGKGFEPAEKEQTKWHAPGIFDKISGEIHKKEANPIAPAKYQDVFGHSLLELAQKNDKIVGITPAMPTGCSMNIMQQSLPKRVFDVGIAEQHAVTFSAGLASEGFIPFCNLYSTFAQRAYDQVIHDVALQKLPVIFCLDRAGLVGSDGPTHHGAYDIAFLRCIPGVVIAAPLNEEELRDLMYSATLHKEGPYVIRYPRGEGILPVWQTPFKAIETGKAKLRLEGEKIVILSFGHIGNEALKAIHELKKQDIHPAWVNMRFVKPLDTELLEKLSRQYPTFITVEDGCLKGGFGSAVGEWLLENHKSNKLISLGIPDEFIEQGTQAEQYRYCGMDARGIVEEVSRYAGKLDGGDLD